MIIDEVIKVTLFRRKLKKCAVKDCIEIKRMGKSLY